VRCVPSAFHRTPPYFFLWIRNARLREKRTARDFPLTTCAFTRRVILNPAQSVAAFWRCWPDEDFSGDLLVRGLPPAAMRGSFPPLGLGQAKRSVGVYLLPKSRVQEQNRQALYHEKEKYDQSIRKGKVSSQLVEQCNVEDSKCTGNIS
jgi:hypothetical protein